MKNKLSILLINPEDIHSSKRTEMSPYVGLAYIAAFLEREFGDDLSIEILEMLPQNMTTKDVLKKIDENHVDLCGITSKTFNFLYAKSLADAIKMSFPEILTIFGGAHATALPDEVVKIGSIDAVIVREGEVAFSNIIKNVLCGKHPFEKVKGVWFLRDGEVFDNGCNEPIQNLDELPIPDWGRYYDLSIYDRYYDNRTGEFHLMIPVFTSRGCPYECNFCYPLLTRKYRFRSVENVINELEYLSGKYKLKRIYFEDSIFGLKRDWFMDFCRQYINRGLHKTLAWGFETNVNCVDLEKMKMAKEAGCVYVYFGLESASDKVLQYLGKSATKEKLYNAINVSKKAGIYQISGSFIFGLPYETSETAKETLEFIKESSLDSIDVNLLDVYPGTELYTMVENEVGGIRWASETKDKFSDCAKTNELNVVRTYVNDLDSVEKLENLYVEALQILHKKYRANYYQYIRKITKFLLFYSFHNRRKLKRSIVKFLKIYFYTYIK